MMTPRTMIRSALLTACTCSALTAQNPDLLGSNKEPGGMGFGNTLPLTVDVSSPGGEAGRIVLVPFVGLAPVDPLNETDEYVINTVAPFCNENDDTPSGLNAKLTGLGIPLTAYDWPIPEVITDDILTRMGVQGQTFTDLTEHSQAVSSTTPIQWVSTTSGWTSAGDRIIDWQAVQAPSGSPTDLTIFHSEDLVRHLIAYQSKVIGTVEHLPSDDLVSTIVGAIQEGLVKLRLFFGAIFVPDNPGPPSLSQVIEIEPLLEKDNSSVFFYEAGSALRLPPWEWQQNPMTNTRPVFHVTTAGATLRLEFTEWSKQTPPPGASPSDIKVFFPNPAGTIDIVTPSQIYVQIPNGYRFPFVPGTELDDMDQILIDVTVPNFEVTGSLIAGWIYQPPTGAPSLAPLKQERPYGLEPLNYSNFIAVPGPNSSTPTDFVPQLIQTLWETML